MSESSGDTIKIVKIVRAASDDLHHAAELRKVMAVEMGSDWDKDHPGWQERFAEYWRQKQEAQVAQVFYAFSGNERVGMLSVSLVDDYHVFVRGRKAGRINAVYVTPSDRRRGIGQALMHSAMDWLREKGCVVVRLHSSEEGAPLYEAMGFRPRREMELSL